MTTALYIATRTAELLVVAGVWIAVGAGLIEFFVLAPRQRRAECRQLEPMPGRREFQIVDTRREQRRSNGLLP